MLKFFRQIRQKLLEQQKVKNYFLYAIGEIILVVIGILIALQINTWNQNRLTKLKEKEILTDFKRELSIEIQELQKVIPQYSHSKKSINNILNHLENDLPYNDSLASDFFNSTNTYDFVGFRTGVYEALKTNGLDLISNKELRNLIIDVYDNKVPWMTSWGNRYIDQVFYAQQNIYNTRFKDFWNGDYKDPNLRGIMIPLNYDKLKIDDEFKYHLRTQLNLIDWLVNKPFDETQIVLTKLMSLINSELDESAKE